MNVRDVLSAESPVATEGVTSASSASSASSQSASSSSGTPVTTEMLKRGWIAPFLLHLHQMLRRENAAVLRWTDDGMAFQILDKDVLTSEVLPKYFKNKNFASFQRQLNYFGFRKWSKAKAEYPTYSREHFTRDNYSAMSLVKRQSKKSRKRPAADPIDDESDRDAKRTAAVPTFWVPTERCKPILPRPNSTPESQVVTATVPTNLPPLALNSLSPISKALAAPATAEPVKQVGSITLDKSLPIISPSRKLTTGCKLPSLRELSLGAALLPSHETARPLWLA